MLDTLRDDDVLISDERPSDALNSSDPLAPECVADRLLLAMRGSTAHNPFAYFEWEDAAISRADAESASVLSTRREAIGLLTKARLAAFVDESRTGVKILNAGRYWALHGGYLAMLQQAQAAATSAPKAVAPPDPLRELNHTYMTWRIRTFWWSFALSTVSFLISIALLIIVLSRGGHY